MKFGFFRGLVWCVCALLCVVPFLGPRAVSPQEQRAPEAKPKSASSATQPPTIVKDSSGDASDEETLRSLSIDSEVLEAKPPVVGSRDEMPGFTREFFEVQWRGGDPIHLYVMLPDGVRKPPVILYLYSYPSETERFRDDNFCRHVTQGGFAAVGFVSALTGQRYHNLPAREWFVSDLSLALRMTVRDVQEVLNYLAKRGDLDMSRVGMFGQGSGGSIAVLSAAADPRIRAVELLNPWGDWPDWVAKSARVPDEERPNYLTKQYLDEAAPLDPVKWLPKLKSQSVHIVDSMDDPITPAVSKKQIEAAVPQPSVQVAEYDKSVTMYGELSGGKLFDWIKRQLQPGSRHEEDSNQSP